MSTPLLSLNDRVRILKGDHEGAIGWIWKIQVEPTTEIKTLVLITVQLSRPYGHMAELLPSMIELDATPCSHDWQLLQEADTGYLCRKCGERHYDENIQPPIAA
ncbi:MAG: hypothetical protein ACTS9Y_13450 [Methylophilus sp.]|uniref:hypothetical protein n=1 Tax=Methylophilus sp. TaxID=29541 RepID=UPI003FA1456D